MRVDFVLVLFNLFGFNVLAVMLPVKKNNTDQFLKIFMICVIDPMSTSYNEMYKICLLLIIIFHAFINLPQVYVCQVKILCEVINYGSFMVQFGALVVLMVLHCIIFILHFTISVRK